jgi:hypothetical protein
MLSRLSSFSGPLSKLFNTIKGFTLNGLILRYEISDRDSYSGSNTVTDLVSNSNATLVSGPTYSINGYLNLDGIDDYLYTNSNLQSSFSGVSPNKSELTSIFMWVYPTDDGVILSEIGVQNTFVGVWHTSIIEMVSGSFKFGLWSDGSGNINVTASIPTPLNNWYYIGMTYNGSTLTTYVDGVNVGTVTFNRLAPYNSGSGLFYSLAHSDTTNMGSDGSYVKMKLGAFQVYNTTISQQQVLNNYNAQKSNYIYTEDMLIWIDANDPQSFSGGTVFDMSGNGYTHTLTAGATSSTLNGIKFFDCTTDNKRIVVDDTGPTLPTTGYTYVVWAKIISATSSFRTLIYTNSPKYTPITIPSGTNTLGYWDSSFRSSGYDISSLADAWVQYSVVGDNSSQTFYINDTQVGSSISYGSGGTTHWGLGNNDIVTQPFGYIGNMMLYSKKLTQEQIKQNYDALKHVYSFPPTQLLLNSSFDDGTNNWTATGGFGAYSYTSSNQVAVLNGVLYFTYVSRTVSQSVTVSDIISSVNTFTGVLNIKRTVSGSNNNDTYSFVLLFKNSSGTTIATKTTGTVIAPLNFTDISLTLNRSEISGTFNDISSIQVNITGLDAGFWNGNHGPVVDYVTLTAS